MMSLNPLLLVGGVIGTVSVLLLIAYACVKDKKTSMGFERSMTDGEILRRLFGYAKPYRNQFIEMCIRDRVGAGDQTHDDGVHVHGELAALLLDGAAAAGGIRLT